MKLIFFLVFVVGLCGCHHKPLYRPVSNGKVLIGIDLDERERVVRGLGYTNGFGGYLRRNSNGGRLTLPFTVDTTVKTRKYGRILISGQDVTVATDAWTVGDEDQIVVTQTRTNTIYRLPNGRNLPADHYIEAVSANWIALGARGKRPWLARLESPVVPVTEIPEPYDMLKMFANDQSVHLFTRKGWAPLRYFRYDLKDGGSLPVEQLSLPWARAVLEYDPETELAVVTGSQRMMAPCWLLDMKTGTRQRINWTDWHFILEKETADNWMRLTMHH